MEKQTATFGQKLELKLLDDSQSTDTKAMTISGYGAVFNNTDQAQDIILAGAFTKTLADHKAAGTLPSMFFNHDSYALPIGVWTAMEEDEIGLKIEGQFLDTSIGIDAWKAAKAGAVTGLSIGYIVIESTIENNIRVISEAKLVEVSLVTFPCNTLARVTDIKSEKDNKKIIERKNADALEALKLAQAAIDKVKALFSSEGDGEDDDQDEKADDVDTDVEADQPDEDSIDEEKALAFASIRMKIANMDFSRTI